jgi:glycosyltransferase involved in cell wall biosynthesis
VLNEERRLPDTLRRTVEYLERRPWTSSILVVDNGSVDATVDLARRPSNTKVRIDVLGCSVRGKGAAVRRGIEWSHARYVGFMDADLATPIETLDTVMSLLEDGAAAVIASRRAPFAGYEGLQSVTRRAGGAFFRLCFRSVVANVADTQCGFKFFSGDVARQFIGGCSINGFVFDVELLARLQDAHYDIREVPVVWTDGPGSTFRLKRDGFAALTDVARIIRSMGPLLGRRP